MLLFVSATLAWVGRAAAEEGTATSAAATPASPSSVVHAFVGQAIHIEALVEPPGASSVRTAFEGPLPPGVKGASELSGTTSRVGSWDIRLVASDADGRAVVEPLRLVVSVPPVAAALQWPIARIPGGPVPSTVEPPAAGGLHETLGNDTVADCVIAAEAHLLEVQGASVGRGVEIAASQALRNFASASAQSGAVAGVYPNVALADLARSGLAGEGILGAAALPDLSPRTVKEAVAHLGGLSATTEMPLQHLESNVAWSPTSAVQATTTHQVAVIGYDPVGPILSIWGGVQHVSWAWWRAYAASGLVFLPRLFVQTGGGPDGAPASRTLANWRMALAAPSVSARASSAPRGYVRVELTAQGDPVSTLAMGPAPSAWSVFAGNQQADLFVPSRSNWNVMAVVAEG